MRPRRQHRSRLARLQKHPLGTQGADHHVATAFLDKWHVDISHIYQTSIGAPAKKPLPTFDWYNPDGLALLDLAEHIEFDARDKSAAPATKPLSES